MFIYYTFRRYIIQPIAFKFKLALFLIVQGCYSDNNTLDEVFTYYTFCWYVIQPGDGILHHLTYHYSGYFPKWETNMFHSDSLCILDPPPHIPYCLMGWILFIQYLYPIWVNWTPYPLIGCWCGILLSYTVKWLHQLLPVF